MLYNLLQGMDQTIQKSNDMFLEFPHVATNLFYVAIAIILMVGVGIVANKVITD